MASLPPQSQPRRKETSSERTPSPSTSPSRQSEQRELPSATDSSQTILVGSAGKSPAEATAEETIEPAVTNLPAVEEADPPDKCWICFNDASEDTPTSSEWRSPCPCALIAHEACLLDWIADLEAPSSRNQAGGEKEIKCPQCKADIQLARPRDFIVLAVRKLEYAAHLALMPAGALVVGGSVFTAATAHGISSIRAVFDTADAKAILAPLATQAATWRESGVMLREHWRIIYGLPLIPPLLILSRTTLADPVFPAIPLAAYAASAWSEHVTDLVKTWPPTPGLSFAVLPYVRAAYNMYWNLTWRKWERKWLAEIRPRASTSEGENGQDAIGAGVEDDLGFGIELDIIEEEVPGNPDDAPADAEDNNEADVIVLQEADEAVLEGDDAAQDPAAVEDAPANADADDHGHVHMHRQLDVNLGPFVSSIMGALVFPHIAGWAGDLLKLALPSSLTALPEVKVAGTLQLGKPTRFLQTRWGRSIVGGCLAVALKDMVMLYVRWKIAVNHRHRRVLNYDKKLKKIVDGPVS